MEEKTYDYSSEDETSELDYAIADHVEETFGQMNEHVIELQNYLKRNARAREQTSDPFNITDRTVGSYFLNDEIVKQFMARLSKCIDNGAKVSYSERQLEYSGIMLDLDIYQRDETSFMHADFMCEFVQEVYEVLFDLVDLDSYNSAGGAVTFAILKRSEVSFDAEKDCFKDGIHILIPTVKITRPLKKFLIEKIRDTIMPRMFKDVSLTVRCEEVMDVNSAHVNVFFYRNAPTKTKKLYNLFKVYSLKRGARSITLSDDTLTFLSETYRRFICWELSINWEARPCRDYKPLIQKQDFQVRKHYEAALEKYYVRTAEDTSHLEDIDIASICGTNPDAAIINELVDIVDIRRATDRTEWIRILGILAKENKEYKFIAKKFSERCPAKFNEADFERYWKDAVDNRRNFNYGIGTLYYYARTDDPVLYKKITEKSIFEVLRSNITNIILDGRLQNATIASILLNNFRGLFKYSAPSGGRAAAWYEFILPSGNQATQDLCFKWKKWEKAYSCPTFESFMTKHLFPMVQEQAEYFQKKLREMRQDPEIEKSKLMYYEMLLRNIKDSGRKLLEAKFKSDVISESKRMFIDTEFANRLDQAEETHSILGVANGILKLGHTVEFINQYHPYPISRYTAVEYKPYDPRDPYVKQVYLTLRNMFTDEESDSFEYLMYYMAATLDFHIKDSLFMLITGGGGNGKTTLMVLLVAILGLIENNGYAAKLQSQVWLVPMKGGDVPSPSLADLQYARFAYSSEFAENARLLLTVMKELTGAEYIRVRRLHENGTTFVIKCLFILLSNYPFEIDGNDDGTWRRIKQLVLKMKFVPEDKFDPTDKYHRLADPSIQKEWSKKPQVQTAFLSILVHFYEQLHRNYEGCLNRVPHDHIKMDTEDFRNKQDKINNYISKRLVWTPSEDDVLQMYEISINFATWHTNEYGRPAEKRGLEDKFAGSKLSKYFNKSKSGNLYLTNHRIKEDDFELREGEKLYVLGGISKKNMLKETPEQYWQRKCEEYDSSACPI